MGCPELRRSPVATWASFSMLCSRPLEFPATIMLELTQAGRPALRRDLVLMMELPCWFWTGVLSAKPYISAAH